MKSPENVAVGAEASQEDHRSEWAVIRGIDRFNAILLTLLAIVLGILACIAIGQVFARYVVRAPLSWSEEVIRFSMIWSVFLGAGVVVRRGMLVAVEAVYIFAPPGLARLITWFALAVSAAFWAIIAYFGWSITERVVGLNSGSMELPMSLVYAAIPIGAVIALVNTIAVAIDPPRPVITQAAS